MRPATDRVIRTAAVFLIAFALIEVAAFIATARVGSTFDERSVMHVDREVQRVRAQIAKIESVLDASVDNVVRPLSARSLSQMQLFGLLHSEVHHIPGRGMRIIGSDGHELAWWGEDLRVSGALTYQFDVTDLYITHSHLLANGVTVQAFERIVNQTRTHSLLAPDDDWITSTIFHGGKLRQDAAMRRYLVEPRPDSRLWIDVLPRTRSEIVANTTAIGRDAAAILLALAALVIAWQWRAGTALMIAFARVALL